MNEKTRHELGKFFIDTGKLFFAGLVLSSLLKVQTFSSELLLGGGPHITVLLVLLGIVIINQKE